MTAPLPPAAERLIRRVYQLAMALKACQVDAEQSRVAVLVTVEEAFLLLDCVRSGAWQISVRAPNSASGRARTSHFDLAIQPRPGMVWARLFGVTLIVESDVTPDTPA